MPEDLINKPKHYNSHPKGYECWDVVGPFGYFIGNAMKYLWRQGLKPGVENIQDLRKAIAFIEKEIKNMEEQKSLTTDNSKGEIKVSKLSWDTYLKYKYGDLEDLKGKILKGAQIKTEFDGSNYDLYYDPSSRQITGLKVKGDSLEPKPSTGTPT